MSWAQGVVSSNLAAPTKSFIFSILFASNKLASRHGAPASGAVDRQDMY